MTRANLIHHHRILRAALPQEDAELSGVSLTADGFVWSSYIDGHAPRTPNSLARAFHRLCRTMDREALGADRPRV